MSSKNALKERIVGPNGDPQTEKRTPSSLQRPSPEEIRRRAFEIHIERGGIHGCDLEDWLEAEKELTEKLRR